MSQEQPDKRPAPTRLRLRDFDRSLPMALLKGREAVMRQFRPGLRRYGISEQQWRILRALNSVDSIEVQKLAQATFLLGPSLSRILKDLEDRDLIQRRTSPQDLRRGVISISPKGRALIELAGTHAEAIYEAVTRAVGADRLRELQALLGELERALAEPVTLPDSFELPAPLPEDDRPKRGRPQRATPPESD